MSRRPRPPCATAPYAPDNNDRPSGTVTVSTIATLRVPASEFVLDEVLSRHEATEARLLRSVQLDGATIAPLLWIQSNDFTSVEAALRDDPSVVNTSRLFSTTDGNGYRVGLRPATDSVMRLFADNRFSVVAASGHDGEWVFRVFAEARDSLATLTDKWRHVDLTHTVERVVTCDDVPNPTRFGLTDSQYHTLVTAFREGYYSVPRESDITAVANILGITHQATSQRLRRGHEQLVQKALVERPAPEFPF